MELGCFYRYKCLCPGPGFGAIAHLNTGGRRALVPSYVISMAAQKQPESTKHKVTHLVLRAFKMGLMCYPVVDKQSF